MRSAKESMELRAALMKEYAGCIEPNDDGAEHVCYKPGKRLQALDLESRIGTLSTEIADAGRGTFTGSPRDLRSDFGSPSGNGGNVLFRNAHNGEKVIAFNGTQKVAAGVPSYPSIGETIVGLLTSDDRALAIRAANIGGSDSAGGFLLNPEMSRTFIDLARAQSVCMRAGAITVPMETAEMTIARLDGDATAYWRAEAQAITASTMTFGKFSLRPKTLAAIVPVSVELLEDAANAPQVIEQALSRSLGVALDRACLRGAGSANEPLGVTSSTAVNSRTSVGTPDDWSDASNMVGDILADNFDGEISRLAWILNPAVGAVYDQLVESTTGGPRQPLRPTPWVEQLRRYFTTTMSTTAMIVGDFSQMVVGMRTSGVRIDVLSDGSVVDGSSATWNASSQLLRHVRAWLRADVALLRPTFFCVGSGVTTT